MVFVDLLSFIHLITYCVVGYFWKERYHYIIIISIFWEILEYYVTTSSNMKKYIKYWPIDKKYWRGTHLLNRIGDIGFNLFGYHIGNNIKEIKIPKL